MNTNDKILYAHIIEKLRFKPILDDSQIALSIKDNGIVVLGGKVKKWGGFSTPIKQKLLFMMVSVLSLILQVCLSSPLFAMDISRDDVLLAARVSAAAYVSSENPKKDNFLVREEHYNTIKKELLREFTNVEEVNGKSPILSRAVMAIDDAKKKAFVAFPGLTDGLPGLNNILFNSKNTTCPCDGDTFLCHGGILLYYLPVKAELLTRLKGLHQERDITRFIFTGHCSGGSKASIAMLDFLNSYKSETVSAELVTFALLPSVFTPRTVTSLKSDTRFKGHHNFWLQNDLWKDFSKWLDGVKGYVPIDERSEIKPVLPAEWWWNTHRLKSYLKALS